MRLVILGSGRGSNAGALLRAEREGRLGLARTAAVLTDRPDAGILAVAAGHGVPGHFIDPAPFRTRLEGEGEARFIAAVQSAGADLVVLAGFMRVLKPRFLAAFAGRIINVHPSLLPAFPGLEAIGQAWQRGVKITGCTVHYVDATVDGGPIIDQAAVRVEEDDTLATLTARVHAAEHQLLPAVVRRLSQSTNVEKCYSP